MKRFLLRSLIVLSLFAAAASPPALAQNLLLDGTLDSGTAGGAGLPGTNAFWTLTNTGNATAAQYQGGFANSQAANGLGLWHRAFLGTAQAPVSSNLSQSVVAPSAGKYLLTFDSIVEQNFTAASLVATLSSSGGPSATLDLLPTRITAGSTYTGGGFANIGAAVPPYSIQQMLMLSGVNAGDTLTVSVAMTDGIGGATNPQSAVVDNFRLTLIPEPSAALSGGLGLLGVISGRRWTSRSCKRSG